MKQKRYYRITAGINPENVELILKNFEGFGLYEVPYLVNKIIREYFERRNKEECH